MPRLVPATALALLVGVTTVARPQDGRLAHVGFDRGDSAAPLLVVEFADFGCSACADFAVQTFPAIDLEFIRDRRVRWKLIPMVLGPFRHSKRAAMAAVCAAEQGGFWPMHDRLYGQRDRWMDPRDPLPVFRAFADSLGLDPSALERCYRRDETEDHVNRLTKLARQYGVRGTPTFLVGERRVMGALPLATFRAILVEEAGR